MSLASDLLVLSFSKILGLGFINERFSLLKSLVKIFLSDLSYFLTYVDFGFCLFFFSNSFR